MSNKIAALVSEKVKVKVQGVSELVLDFNRQLLSNQMESPVFCKINEMKDTVSEILGMDKS